MSDAIDSTAENKMSGLGDALLAVQMEAQPLRKDSTNPHYKSKYVSLDAVMDTALPLLNKHGLVWVTLPGWKDGTPVLTYRLVHVATGERLEESMPLMLSKEDPQGQGSALTYARRYSIMAVLGLVADEDDDGNRASRRGEPEAPYGAEANQANIDQAKNALAYTLGCAPTAAPVKRVFERLSKDAGYLSWVACRAVSHVGTELMEWRKEQEQPEAASEVDAAAEADRAVRAAEEARRNAEAMRGTIG